jgi:hypothetical protein
MRIWLLALALMAIAASPAAAGTLYSTPKSTRTTQPCAQATPCKLDYAMLAAQSGDDVSIAPGDYYETGTTPYAGIPPVRSGVRVYGSSSSDLPVIHGLVGANDVPFAEVQSGGKLGDVELISTLAASATVTTGYTLRINPGATVERTFAHGIAPAGTSLLTCDMPGGVLLHSLCLGTGAGFADGVAAHSATGTQSLTLVNVTAISTAPTGAGLVLSTDGGNMSLTALSVIAIGSKDIVVNTNQVNGTARIFANHSNWKTQTVGGTGTSQLNDQGGNQTGATYATPVFVKPDADDYREARNSPTIDAGAFDSGSGNIALGGLPRVMGAAVDIGAYEYQPVPTATTGAATDVTDSTATLNGTVAPDRASFTARFDYGTTTAYGRSANATGADAVSAGLTGLAPDTTYHYRLIATSPGGGTGRGQDRSFRTPVPAAGAQAAVVSRVSIGRRWRLGRHLPRFSRKRPPVGTTIRFSLSRGAKVTLTFKQRVKKGRRTRLVKRGTLTSSGFAGPNKVRFQGRLTRRKKLKPGRYVLTVSVAGSTRSTSASFTIVR